MTMYIVQVNGRVVARAQHTSQTNLEKEEQETGIVAANARLIAAAPDLLAACHDFLNPNITSNEKDSIARAAIAKAKGE